MTTFTAPGLKTPVEAINDKVFHSHAFFDRKNIQALRSYMKTWEKELQECEKVATAMAEEEKHQLIN